MAEYSRSMEKYDEDGIEKMTLPILPKGQKQIAMVTQDESTFYSNE